MGMYISQLMSPSQRSSQLIIPLSFKGRLGLLHSFARTWCLIDGQRPSWTSNLWSPDSSRGRFIFGSGHQDPSLTQAPWSPSEIQQKPLTPRRHGQIPKRLVSFCVCQMLAIDSPNMKVYSEVSAVVYNGTHFPGKCT